MLRSKAAVNKLILYDKQTICFAIVQEIGWFFLLETFIIETTVFTGFLALRKAVLKRVK